MAFTVYQNMTVPQSPLSPVSLGSLCRLLGQTPDSCLPIKEQHPWASVWLRDGHVTQDGPKRALTRAGTATVSFLVQDA